MTNIDNNSRLLKRMTGGDTAARNSLVEGNMGLVYSAARHFSHSGEDLEDLIQIGSVGLIKAAERFDTGYGVKFSTYAVPMIIGEIKRFLRDNGEIKVSRSLKEAAVKGRRCEELLRKRFGREPTITEISAESEIPAEKLFEAFAAVTPPESLYREVSGGDKKGITLMDTVEGEGMEEKVINRVLVREIMSRLNDRERKIIMLRYFRGRTQSEIAELIGVSQVQISRIEKKAIEKIRAEMR